METALHRELKLLYAGRAAQYEAPWEGCRIYAIVRGWQNVGKKRQFTAVSVRVS